MWCALAESPTTAPELVWNPLEPVIPSRTAVLAAGPGQAQAPAGEQALWEEGLAADGGLSSADREGDVVSSTA